MAHKSKEVLIYLLLLISFTVLGQSSFDERNSDIFIYKEYIDTISDTTLVILNNEAFTTDNYDGGSRLTGVFVDDELVKISSWFGLSYGIVYYDYYVKNKELVFVEENFKGFKYDTQKNKFDYSKFDIGAQGWYLFKSGNLIDTESLGHWRFEDDSINPEQKLISEFNKYFKLLMRN